MVFTACQQWRATHEHTKARSCTTHVKDGVDVLVEEEVVQVCDGKHGWDQNAQSVDGR